MVSALPAELQRLVESLPRSLEAALKAQHFNRRLFLLFVTTLYSPANVSGDSDVLSAL